MKDCQVPVVFLRRDATLACYACGRTTSAVVDIGYHGRTATPVYEGYVEQKGIGRTPIGSKAMDELVLEKFKPWSRVASRLCILVLVRGTQQTRDHISLGFAPAIPR
jgi:actin-related protein